VSRHWANVGEAGALGGMRFMVWVNKHIGRFAFSLFLVPVMAYFYVRRTGPRRASKEFLRRVKRCYPEALCSGSLSWLSFRHFMTFGDSLLDKYLAWVDTPSGIDTTTGTVYDPVIKATATMTLALPKQGLRADGVAECLGELYLADISVPPGLYSKPPLNKEVGFLFARDDIVRIT
jgi:hypothetical protein